MSYVSNCMEKQTMMILKISEFARFLGMEKEMNRYNMVFCFLFLSMVKLFYMYYDGGYMIFCICENP